MFPALVVNPSLLEGLQACTWNQRKAQTPLSCLWAWNPTIYHFSLSKRKDSSPFKETKLSGLFASAGHQANQDTLEVPCLGSARAIELICHFLSYRWRKPGTSTQMWQNPMRCIEQQRRPLWPHNDGDNIRSCKQDRLWHGGPRRKG